MTLQEFKDKYLNLGKVEYHSFGTGALYQCVDLANQYIAEVLKKTPIIGTDAKDFKNKFNPDEFEWIVNTTEAKIKAGDIPVWTGRVGGGAGHIAVALSDGSLDNFFSLDQNWSQKERVTIELHNYTNVAGWLRPRGTTQPQDPISDNSWKEKAHDDILIEAYKRSITSDDVSENWKDGKLKDRIFDHIDDVEEERDTFKQENQEVKNERDEVKKANITLNAKIEDLTNAIGKDAVNDHDLAIKNLELEKEIEKLKKEQVAPIEPVIEHYQPILDEFWKNLFKGKRTKPLLGRLKSFVGRYFDGK